MNSEANAHRRLIAIDEGWQLAGFAPDAVASPDALGAAAAQWHPAEVPGTVGAILHKDLDVPGDYDASDWWYRTTFAMPANCSSARHYLRFDGLASLAQVWLNGKAILDSRNMFVAQRVDVTGELRDVNHIAIRFASLTTAMAAKRPRPRWRTALVEAQNLRWFRTTLLGRMPGWNPLVSVVGPWGPIALECVEKVDVVSLDLQTRVDGHEGHVKVRAEVRAFEGHVEAARLRVGSTVEPLAVSPSGTIEGDVAVPNAPLWWPHTHGTPRRVRCLLELKLDGEWIAEDLGLVGFKDLALDTRDGRVQVHVNGTPVFCRGACWTTADILRLRADPRKLRRLLELARDAGVNMLRVGGTMHYECDEFYALCDDLGIMVWQDFMFANMDYPVGEPAFRAEVEAEASHVLGRLQRHPCIAVYCGGSEIAQQAAMMGLPADEWTNPFFVETLPRLCAGKHAGIPYFPSTPWGGALPFHVGTGTAHYYGVGAYRRPLSDVKTARVKFAAESLAFANVPEPQTMALMMKGQVAPAPHHPKWKARVPRDNGAGWDFEDTRDHYLGLLFGEDPVALRSQDLERYYALSRVVSGEAMLRTFAEWRAPSSGCGGALVWTMLDVWPGAGWGLIDSTGLPKAAYWYAKRAWASRAVLLTDEGLDGLALHVLNDCSRPLDATVEIEMFRDGRIATAAARLPLHVPAHGSVSRHVDALLGYFSDATNAYRFGPPKQDVVTARIRRSDTGEVLAEDFFFPLGMKLPVQAGATVTATASWEADGKVAVTLRSDVFLQAVNVSCDGFTPGDNYFHVAPNQQKRIILTPADASTATFMAHFEALNLREVLTVRSVRPTAANEEHVAPAKAGNK